MASAVPELQPTVPRQDLMLLLSLASHALQTELTAGLAGLGISPRAQCVLTHAQRSDQTQSQLAQQCGLDKTTMVVTLDELEKSGLAQRRLSSTDRRARIVVLTPAGQEILARAQTIVSGIFDDVLGALPAGERDVFVAGLERLVAGRLATPVECERPVRRPRSPRMGP
jgi:MarR family transcriptional regulator, transcriptional regulator for hemolysin